MKSIIAEKLLLDLATGATTAVYAVATSERNPYSIRTSLTYEGHLTEWDPDRTAVEALQRIIEAGAEEGEG